MGAEFRRAMCLFEGKELEDREGPLYTFTFVFSGRKTIIKIRVGSYFARPCADNIRERLQWAFAWDETKEGFAYWDGKSRCTSPCSRKDIDALKRYCTEWEMCD